MNKVDMLVIGGSDAGISSALRARELNSNISITIILADEYPNLSICGIPYAISKEVDPWENLAHRTIDDLKAYDLEFFMNTKVKKISSDNHVVEAIKDGKKLIFTYDKLVVGTGAMPRTLPVEGGTEGVHVLHTMDDFLNIKNQLNLNKVKNAAIIGAGYVGIEVAEALRKLDISTTLYQRGKTVLSTVDKEFGELIEQKLLTNGVDIKKGISIKKIIQIENNLKYRLSLSDNEVSDEVFDFVLIVTGVVPNSHLLAAAGAKIDEGTKAVIVDETMLTTLPDIYAAGDLVMTKHRLLGHTYLPLGTTSHKQGRIAGANIAEYHSKFAGIIGSQVLRIFDYVVSRTGILSEEAKTAGYKPVSVIGSVDDHKAYYPGAKKIIIKLTADKVSHKILGAQLLGSYGSEVAKRSDIFATAIYNEMTVEEFSNLDLTYSPVIGSPWDAVQLVAQKLESELNNKN